MIFLSCQFFTINARNDSTPMKSYKVLYLCSMYVLNTRMFQNALLTVRKEPSTLFAISVRVVLMYDEVEFMFRSEIGLIRHMHTLRLSLLISLNTSISLWPMFESFLKNTSHNIFYKTKSRETMNQFVHAEPHSCVHNPRRSIPWLARAVAAYRSKVPRTG